MLRPNPALATIFLALPAAAQEPVSQFWMNNCAACHARNGSGGVASSLLDDHWTIAGDPRSMFDTVKHGLPNYGMEAYGEAYSDEQIWAITNYIYELRERHRREVNPPPGQVNDTVESDHHTYRIVTWIARDLEIPWAIDWLPDGRALVTERQGTLRIAEPDGTLSRPVRDTPTVRAVGQGGLLDVAVSPDYADTGFIYLAYTDPLERRTRGRTMTRIVRGRIENGRWTEQQDIWQARPEHYEQTRLHYGCRFAFDDAGHVFFAIGDRGRGHYVRDLASPYGKVHRLKLDGTVPDDNPFADRDPENTYLSIWSLGHRNPQGLVMHPDGTLYETEHGPRGGDELNIIHKAADYGWHDWSYGINYNGLPFHTPWPPEDEGITMPVFVWLPSTAACGLDVVTGDAFPGWNGDLLASGLAGEIVERLRVVDGEVTEREEVIRGLGRVRDTAVSPEGEIYILLERPGRIIKLVRGE